MDLPGILERLEPRLLLSTSPNPVDVLGYRDDLTGVGVNSNETILTPGNIGYAGFAKRFTTAVDGQVYAEPLYVAGVSITTGSEPGLHNVVFVATEHDSLYAIDGDSGDVLWQTSFINPGAGITTVPQTETGSGDISNEIGITATPAIDLASDTIFVEAKTKQVVGGLNHYVHTLYGVNIGSGAVSRSTVIADTTYSGSTYTYNSGPYVLGTGDGSITVGSEHRVYFNALRQMDRPGITLYNGNIYMAFASHGDNGPYHGWVLSYDITTLALNGVLNTTPNGGLGGIWQAGGTLTVDAQGYLYCETGNGSFNQNTSNFNAQGFPTDGDYGDSFIKIGRDPGTSQSNMNVNGWGLKVVDYFTPFNQASLSSADTDLGSGGPTVLPDSVGSVAHPHLLVGGGKEGKIYLIDRDNMGKFNATTDQVVQEIGSAVGGILSTPAYFNGTLYYTGSYSGPIKAFAISNAHITTTPTSQTTDTYGNLDGSPMISADGTNNGILWNLERGTGQMRAYDASNLATQLYTTAQAPGNRDQLGTVQKFSVPTVASGRVYVGVSGSLVAYGPPTPPTSVPSNPTTLTATAKFPTEIDLAWSDNSNNEDYFAVERSPNGTTGWQQIGTSGVNVSTYKDTSAQPSTQYFYRVYAHNSLGNSGYSNVASATTSSALPIGAGDGLLGMYYDNIDDTNLKVTRVDPTVNFNWAAGSPDPSIGVDTFSVIWTGEVQAQYSENYTFYTTSDDGIRVILAGQTIINNYADHGSTVNTSSPIALVAGQSYSIEIDYYENGGSAVAELRWSSPSTPQAVVPKSQLFSGVAPVAPSNLAVTPTSGTEVSLTWQDNSANETGFAIERKTGAGGVYEQVNLVNPNTTSTTDTALIQGQTYYYRVRATNFGSNSGPSNEVGVTLPVPPITPSGAHTTSVTMLQIALAWQDNSGDESEFRVYRRTGAGEFVIIATLPPNTTSYVDNGPGNAGLTPGIEYDYHIQAGNIAGYSDFTGVTVSTLDRVGPTWTGAVNTHWELGGNWDALAVPDGAAVAALDGLVPVNQPVLFADQAVQGLDVLTTGWTMNLSGHTLSVGTDGLSLPGGSSPTAKINVGDGNVVVAYGGASPLQAIEGWIKAGGGSKTDGAHYDWNGAGGITTSAIVGGDNVYRSLGLRDNGFAMANRSPMTQVDGAAVPAGAVVVKYTWIGDMDLDGSVTVNDYLEWLYYYRFQPAPENISWMTGDFNYDGQINVNDYLALLEGYRNQSGPLGDGSPLTPIAPASTSAATEPAAQTSGPLAAAMSTGNLVAPAEEGAAIRGLLRKSGGTQALAVLDAAAAEAVTRPAAGGVNLEVSKRTEPSAGKTTVLAIVPEAKLASLLHAGQATNGSNLLP
jgi:hypothetical protein